MQNVLNDPQNNDESVTLYVILSSIRSLETERLEMKLSGTYHDCLGIDTQIAFRQMDLAGYWLQNN